MTLLRQGGGTRTDGGTSYAAPLVAGAAAQNDIASPAGYAFLGHKASFIASPQDIETGTWPDGGPRIFGYDQFGWGWGSLDVHKAFWALRYYGSGAFPSQFTFQPRDAGLEVNFVLAWHAEDNQANPTAAGLDDFTVNCGSGTVRGEVFGTLAVIATTTLSSTQFCTITVDPAANVRYVLAVAYRDSDIT